MDFGPLIPEVNTESDRNGQVRRERSRGVNTLCESPPEFSRPLACGTVSHASARELLRVALTRVFGKALSLSFFRDGAQRDGVSSTPGSRAPGGASPSGSAGQKAGPHSKIRAAPLPPQVRLRRSLSTLSAPCPHRRAPSGLCSQRILPKAPVPSRAQGWGPGGAAHSPFPGSRGQRGGGGLGPELVAGGRGCVGTAAWGQLCEVGRAQRTLPGGGGGGGRPGGTVGPSGCEALGEGVQALAWGTGWGLIFGDSRSLALAPCSAHGGALWVRGAESAFAGGDSARAGGLSGGVPHPQAVISCRSRSLPLAVLWACTSGSLTEGGVLRCGLRGCRAGGGGTEWEPVPTRRGLLAELGCAWTPGAWLEAPPRPPKPSLALISLALPELKGEIDVSCFHLAPGPAPGPRG